MNPLAALFEEDLVQIRAVCDRLCRESNSKSVVLVDRNGQLISVCGDYRALDTTSLAALAAGNVAATTGLAKLVGEKEFPSNFFEGKQESIQMSMISYGGILLVIFDNRTSLGLVRLRMKRAIEGLNVVLGHAAQKVGNVQAPSALGEITDEDIDNLFGS